jgi:HK97 family phage major capsid protein
VTEVIKNLDSEIDGLTGALIRDTMGKTYASREAKLALSNRLLNAAGANHDGATEREKRELAAFDKFLRIGRDRLSQEEKTLLREARDMGEAGYATGTATGGGVFVPLDFNHAVTSAMKDFSPLLSLARIVPTPTGAPRPFPLDFDANMTGELTGENQQRNLGDISAPGQVILSAFKFDSKEVRLSRELLQDQEVNLPEYLAQILGTRLGRVVSTYCTTGTGSGQTALSWASSLKPR